jgi:hypothetical protein
VVLANLEANARIRADRDGWWVGAEGFSCPVACTDAHAAEAERLRASAWAVWDLHFGKALAPELEPDFAAVPRDIRLRIEKLATTANTIAGHDFYPVSIVPVGGTLDGWSIEQRLDAYEATARAWQARYGLDFWVAETSNLGLPVAEQEAWLSAFARRLGGMRRSGLPVRGLCWYSRGDQYDWDSALTARVGRVTEVGLFAADRSARPVAARFRELAAGGAP